MPVPPEIVLHVDTELLNDAIKRNIHINHSETEEANNVHRFSGKLLVVNRDTM